MQRPSTGREQCPQAKESEGSRTNHGLARHKATGERHDSIRRPGSVAMKRVRADIMTPGNKSPDVWNISMAVGHSHEDETIYEDSSQWSGYESC